MTGSTTQQPSGARISKALALPLNMQCRWLFYLLSGAVHRAKYGFLHGYNLIRLRGAGVRPGRNFSTAGAIILDLFPGSEVSIGRNVTIVSDPRRSNAASLAFPAKLKTFSGTSRILIGDNVGLNGTSITSRSCTISISDGTLVGPNVIIVDSDFHNPWHTGDRNTYSTTERDGDVLIGRNCWIGMNSLILKGVRIGDNSVVAAGSVVVKDIPENALAAGVPAKVIREYK